MIIDLRIIFIPVPPVWIQKPSDKEALSEHSANLPCSTAGKPEPVVQWYFSSKKYILIHLYYFVIVITKL